MRKPRHCHRCADTGGRNYTKIKRCVLRSAILKNSKGYPKLIGIVDLCPEHRIEAAVTGDTVEVC